MFKKRGAFSAASRDGELHGQSDGGELSQEPGNHARNASRDCPEADPNAEPDAGAHGCHSGCFGEGAPQLVRNVLPSCNHWHDKSVSPYSSNIMTFNQNAGHFNSEIEATRESWDLIKVNYLLLS